MAKSTDNRLATPSASATTGHKLKKHLKFVSFGSNRKTVYTSIDTKPESPLETPTHFEIQAKRSGTKKDPFRIPKSNKYVVDTVVSTIWS